MLKKIIVFSLLACSHQVLMANPFGLGLQSSSKAIYGDDDRIDIYNTNYSGKKAASSIVALVKTHKLQEKSSGYKLSTRNYGSAMGLCSSVRFYQQPVAAFCSGVVIGSKYVLTAGHCNKTSNCSDISFLLDFDMTSSSSARTHFKQDQVYNCRRVAAKGDYPSDWQILELDRNIAAPAVKVSEKGRAGQSDNKNFTIIGHPTGLPKKIAANGQYILQERDDVYRASLDSYHGNSGSPVFNTNSLKRGTPELEGVLVNGNTDFVRQNGCLIENHCKANSTSRECTMKGEGVTDIRYIISKLGNNAGIYFSSLSEPAGSGTSTSSGSTRPWPGSGSGSGLGVDCDSSVEGCLMDDNKASDIFDFSQ